MSPDFSHRDPGLPPPSSAAGTCTSASTIFIAGPTAVGKSELALAIASRLGGEIISVDSMQVYRGLDLGTAKPAPEDRIRVPHHLIDVVDLATPFDAAQFIGLARQAVTEIQQRGRVPILCGGTGLYFKAFLEGVGTGPAPDPALRAGLEAQPPSELLEELKRSDPGTFERIDRNNLRRVIRAIEVIRLTGRPASELRSNWRRTPGARGPFLGLWRSTEDLRRRIDDRVERMFTRGLVGEVAALRERGLERNRTAMQAIGYRQVVEYLGGARSLADTIELVKRRTRQFARRQMTWFRGQFDLEWIDVTGQVDLSVLADKLFESGGKLGL